MLPTLEKVQAVLVIGGGISGMQAALDLAEQDIETFLVEREEFKQEWGIQELARPRLLESSYRLLDLISFLTMGDKEVRAWPIPREATAAQAAGKIHSDIERGFIRAEVIHYDQLRETGSLAEAKKRGLLRLEGKDYIVQDGDVITFRFNI